MYIALIILGIVVLAIILIYNRLVKLRNIMQKSQSAICVYLQQRFDLIPNLVNVAKGYMEYEKETFEEITRLRTRCLKQYENG